jgi:putative addiction module component (TIGR02574 family)
MVMNGLLVSKPEEQAMATDLATLIAEVRTLERSEQEQVLRALMEEFDSSSAAEVEAAWLDEIRRRSAEIDAGRARLIPAEAVYASILNRLSHANAEL